MSFHSSFGHVFLQVLKVDGAYVAVKFPGSMSSQSAAAPADSDPSSLLQDCRLLRIDELQVQALMIFPKSLYFDTCAVFLLMTLLWRTIRLFHASAGGQNWWHPQSSRLFSAHTEKTVHSRKGGDSGCKRWLQRCFFSFYFKSVLQCICRSSYL